MSGIDRLVGRINVPLAVAARLEGIVGQYGFEDDATAVLPPVVGAESLADVLISTYRLPTYRLSEDYRYRPRGSHGCRQVHRRWHRRRSRDGVRAPQARREGRGGRASAAPPTWTRTNHRGEPISLLEGPAVAVGLVAGAAVGGGNAPGATAFATAAAGGFGLVDDLAEDTSARTKGLRGHLGALVEGRLTTGGLKVLGISGSALVAAAVGTRAHGQRVRAPGRRRAQRRPHRGHREPDQPLRPAARPGAQGRRGGEPPVHARRRGRHGRRARRGRGGRPRRPGGEGHAGRRRRQRARRARRQPDRVRRAPRGAVGGARGRRRADAGLREGQLLQGHRRERVAEQGRHARPAAGCRPGGGARTRWSRLPRPRTRSRQARPPAGARPRGVVDRGSWLPRAREPRQNPGERRAARHGRHPRQPHGRLRPLARAGRVARVRRRRHGLQLRQPAAQPAVRGRGGRRARGRRRAAARRAAEPGGVHRRRHGRLEGAGVADRVGAAGLDAGRAGAAGRRSWRSLRARSSA